MATKRKGKQASKKALSKKRVHPHHLIELAAHLSADVQLTENERASRLLFATIDSSKSSGRAHPGNLINSGPRQWPSRTDRIATTAVSPV